jgi:hypothetical protein
MKTVDDVIAKLKTMGLPEQDASYVDQDSYEIGYCVGYNAAARKALAMVEELTDKTKQEVQKMEGERKPTRFDRFCWDAGYPTDKVMELVREHVRETGEGLKVINITPPGDAERDWTELYGKCVRIWKVTAEELEGLTKVQAASMICTLFDAIVEGCGLDKAHLLRMIGDVNAELGDMGVAQ